MTNEQLTQSLMELVAYKAKAEEEYSLIKSSMQELKEEIQSTKTLAEDVHIMAINMESMQKAQEEINAKVDQLTRKDYIEYEENKKMFKQKISATFIGAGATFLIALIGWLINIYIQKGGM